MEKIYRTVIIDDEESAIDNLCFEFISGAIKIASLQLNN